ncbi:early nodulin-like protein 2 [Prosopis cineraria]|uniref:early nodulin-like protein 2 n=1 Tax=Prosopis cineraria TaxID=364024 RepID=UPI0024100B24|nr:early nodulin-like protein 2 [Prosopis cineraria]
MYQFQCNNMGSEPYRLLDLFLLMIPTFLLCLSSSQAFKFYVGGKDGWVLKPSEGYNHWAERNRFQVNDTLYFKYKKGSDSVLVVEKADYDSCNTKNPMKKMNDGDSYFIFDKSGPYFFISGNSNNCQKGQKLIVVVLAVRNSRCSPPMITPALPPVGGNPPVVSPGSLSPQPSQGPSADDNSPAPSPPPPSGSASFGGHVCAGCRVGIMLLLNCFVWLA